MAGRTRVRDSYPGALIRRAAPLSLLFLLSLVALSCSVETSEEDFPPARPRGLTSISGDGRVTLIWYPNQEPDLAGYEIWRSTSPVGGFVRIATVGPATTEYVDRDVINGKTYYYRIAAFDRDGNLSDLSPETAEDTPRPEGRNVTLTNVDVDPNRAAFAFANGDFGPIPWDRDGDGFLDQDADIYYWFDDEFNVPYILSDHEDLFMQDVGYHDSMDEVDVAPIRGYTTFSVEVVEGHVYVFFTPDGHYAKIRVTRVSRDAITFDWAYQLQRENTDLAPLKLVEGATPGARRR
ncbi:MAG: hypothetical protein KatS3mg115_1050 [Candidatus Poribacteria bacterium]|nr:MAG: hypothetical protein KatS3mg115_1050 [Candidatus Poribacteria bacterium]